MIMLVKLSIRFKVSGFVLGSVNMFTILRGSLTSSTMLASDFSSTFAKDLLDIIITPNMRLYTVMIPLAK